MSEVGVDVDQLRKGLKRIQTKLKRHLDRFTKMLAEDSPATTDFYILEEAYKSVESLHKDYTRKADELDGEEEDGATATEDEKDYEAFQELMIATKFVIKLLLSKRAVHQALTSLETALDILNKQSPEETTLQLWPSLKRRQPSCLQNWRRPTSRMQIP